MPAQRFDLYQVAKAVYWALPGALREYLHGARHYLARVLRTRRVVNLRLRSADASWTDLRTQLLNSRERAAPILVLEPTIDWNATLFQRPQQMARALGRKGCLVLYRTAGDAVDGARLVAPNVWLVSGREVEDLIGAVWCFYSTATLCSPEQMVARRMRGRVVYEYIDCIDNTISGSKAEVRRLLTLRNEALKSADYIVASSRALYAEMNSTGTSARLAYIPNGADAAHFRHAEHTRTPLSERFLEFRRGHETLVGYYGAIAPWLWFDVLTKLARALPNVGFVYIGPDYGGCAHKLPRSKNALYLGAVDYSVLPAYASRFDVCFIPFAPGVVARTTSPIKLFEYFALQKPVVVTADMRECTGFRQVFSGKNVQSLIKAFEDASLAAKSLTYRKSVLQLANANTWDERAQAYIDLLGQRFERGSATIGE